MRKDYYFIDDTFTLLFIVILLYFILHFICMKCFVSCTSICPLCFNYNHVTYSLTKHYTNGKSYHKKKSTYAIFTLKKKSFDCFYLLILKVAFFPSLTTSFENDGFQQSSCFSWPHCWESVYCILMWEKNIFVKKKKAIKLNFAYFLIWFWIYFEVYRIWVDFFLSSLLVMWMKCDGITVFQMENFIYFMFIMFKIDKTKRKLHVEP